MKEEKRLVWVDTEHLEYWLTRIKYLESNNFVVTQICRNDTYERLTEAGKLNDAFLIHCGSYRNDALLPLIEAIKAANPKIKIGLQSDVLHPEVDGLIDFQITARNSAEQIFEELSKAFT